MGAIFSKFWGGRARNNGNNGHDDSGQGGVKRSSGPGHKHHSEKRESRATAAPYVPPQPPQPQLDTRPSPPPRAERPRVEDVPQLAKPIPPARLQYSAPAPPALPKPVQTYKTTFETKLAPPASPVLETIDIDADIVDHGEDQVDHDMENAVIKIQAGVRGFLARQNVKNLKKDHSTSEDQADHSIVPPPSQFTDPVDTLNRVAPQLAESMQLHNSAPAAAVNKPISLFTSESGIKVLGCPQDSKKFKVEPVLEQMASVAAIQANKASDGLEKLRAQAAVQSEHIRENLSSGIHSTCDLVKDATKSAHDAVAPVVASVRRLPAGISDRVQHAAHSASDLVTSAEKSIEEAVAPVVTKIASQSKTASEKVKSAFTPFVSSQLSSANESFSDAGKSTLATSIAVGSSSVAEQVQQKVVQPVAAAAANVQTYAGETVQDAAAKAHEAVGEQEAAVRIQAAYRGFKTRKEMSEFRTGSPDRINLTGDDGHRMRSNFMDSTGSALTSVGSLANQAVGSVSSTTDSYLSDASRFAEDMNIRVTPEPEEAATKIQAAFRGYQVRKTLSREPSPEPSSADMAHTYKQNAEEAAMSLLGGVNSALDAAEQEAVAVLDKLEEDLVNQLVEDNPATVVSIVEPPPDVTSGSPALDSHLADVVSQSIDSAMRVIREAQSHLKKSRDNLFDLDTDDVVRCETPDVAPLSSPQLVQAAMKAFDEGIDELLTETSEPEIMTMMRDDSVATVVLGAAGASSQTSGDLYDALDIDDLSLPPEEELPMDSIRRTTKEFEKNFAWEPFDPEVRPQMSAINASDLADAIKLRLASEAQLPPEVASLTRSKEYENLADALDLENLELPPEKETESESKKDKSTSNTVLIAGSGQLLALDQEPVDTVAYLPDVVSSTATNMDASGTGSRAVGDSEADVPQSAQERKDSMDDVAVDQDSELSRARSVSRGPSKGRRKRKKNK